MINLTDEERHQVERFIRQGKAKARSITRAHILVKSANGWSIQHIVETLGEVLKDKVQQKRRSALAGEEEALLVALACSPVPDGHDHWTLRMLRDKLVELDVVESISAATVQSRLKKTYLVAGDILPGEKLGSL